ncbi:MAG: hypothetical protein MMC33_003852 [Icmadophila ericetorum]|nr:hypothetical protein [Icmadophila ericetorum]
MRLPTPSTRLLLSILSYLTLTTAASLTLTIPTHHNVLTNPSTLPPSTHATLTTTNLTLSAPLRRSNTFRFTNIPTGSYLCDIYSRDFAFAPLRVDVSEGGEKDAGVVEVWQTFRGNKWENLGEKYAAGKDVTVEAKLLGKKEFYESRGGFNVLSLLSNPMILIALVGGAMMFGMPYLMDNMDPELKKEFEEQQKSGGMLGGTGINPSNPMGNFDIAGWMADKTIGSGSGAGTGTGNGTGTVSSGREDVAGGSGGGGGKARRRG